MQGLHKKLVLGLIAVAVVTSAAWGSWQLWSQDDAPFETREPQVLPEPASTREAPTRQAPVPEPIVVAETKPSFKPVVPATEESESVKVEELRKKERPSGKNHDPANALLAKMIRRLHNDAYDHFIRQPGMGMSRMMPVLSVVQREWKIPDWTSEELAKEPPLLKGARDLSLMHRLNLNDFADSNTKTEKERWAAESKRPLPGNEYLWEIKALDLVGLVVHDTAKVYISEKLPDMKNLKHTPVRDLDLFESEGLEELHNGKDLYIRSKDGTIRVLGPIHAGKACLKCHADVKEGTMLGAFSYTLRPGQYTMNGRGVIPVRPAIENPMSKRANEPVP